MERSMTRPRIEPFGGSHSARLAPLGLLVAALLASCGSHPDRMEIAQARTASKPSIRALPGVTSAQRFGGSMGSTRGMGAAGGASGTEAGAGTGLAFEAPQGWEQLPASSLRPINLRPAGDPDAECYVTVLSGDGGGLVANIDRWRKQLGLEAMTPAEADALGDLPLMGGTAKLVELEGAYSGMGDEARAGWKLIGAVLLRPGSAIFVKMTGPAALVDAEKQRFLAFCASLDEGGSDSQGPAAAQASAPPASAPSGPLAWTAPQGWSEGAPKPMRVVTFQVAQESECYVTLLGGEGGGLVPNLDRWRGELGLAPTTPEEVAAMERVPMLGRDAIVFEGVGTFSSMGGAPRDDFAIFGAICMRGADSVFVKMVGPSAEVLPRRDEFIRFLSSMQEVSR
jgi:hypothetical protein